MNITNQNQSYLNDSVVVPGSNVSSQNDVKLNEDRYEVYINDNFVGQKTLTYLSEQLSVIKDLMTFPLH